MKDRFNMATSSITKDFFIQDDHFVDQYIKHMDMCSDPQKYAEFLEKRKTRKTPSYKDLSNPKDIKAFITLLKSH